MGLRINQNIMAMNSYRNLTTSESQLSKSLEKLSSGFRINKAADDASGLVISEGLRSQVRGLKMAIKNTQDGVSVVQTAEGALTEVHSLLQRIRELAVQASSTGSSDPAARNAAQAEVTQLISEVNRIATTTRFGGQKLLDGTYGESAIAATAFDDGTAAVLRAASTTGDFVANGPEVDTYSADDKTFLISLDGVTSSIVTLDTDTTDHATFETELNDAIDAAVGANVVTATVVVSADGNNFQVQLTRDGAASLGEVVTVAANPAEADAAFFGSVFGTPSAQGVTTQTPGAAGVFSVAASAIGETAANVTGATVNPPNYDYSADNQTFQVSLDGGETFENVTLVDDLTDADAATIQQAIQDAIDNNANLVGLVAAEVRYSNSDGGIEVRLRTTDLGSDAQIMAQSDGVDDVFENLFGGTEALSGSGSSAGGIFQVGADGGETIKVSIRNIEASALGLDNGGSFDAIEDIDISQDASAALEIIDAAITQVSTQRGDLGAIQNRFEHTIANLSVTVENLSASESRIRDTDMAEEMMSFTRAQILQQAGTAMLAQANAVPQSVLQLLQ